MCAADPLAHRDQGPFALFMGPVGSQGGDRHGEDAHDVEGDEGGVLTFQLQAEDMSKGSDFSFF